MQAEVYRSLTDRWGRARTYETPGRPRKAEMKLAEWLDKEGKSRMWLAEQLGLSVRQIHRLCSGASKPNLKTALVIEKLTNGEVKPSDFINVAE